MLDMPVMLWLGVAVFEAVQTEVLPGAREAVFEGPQFGFLGTSGSSEEANSAAAIAGLSRRSWALVKDEGFSGENKSQFGLATAAVWNTPQATLSTRISAEAQRDTQEPVGRSQ